MPDAAKPQASPSSSWYAIYLQGKPIGGDHESEQLSMLDGRRCVLSTSESATAIAVLGTSVRQQVASSTWSDPVSREPLREEVVMTSGGVTTKVTATFTARQVLAILDSGGRDEHVTLDIPPGAELLADDPTLSAHPTGHKAMEKRSYVYFDPQTLSLAPVTILPVTARGTQPSSEQVHGQKQYQVSIPGGTVIVTEDAAGETLRVDLPAGLSMARVAGGVAGSYIARAESASNQPLDANAASNSRAAQQEPSAPDFAAVTSVVPTGAPLLPMPVSLQAEVTLASGETRVFRLHEIAPPTPQQVASFATVTAIKSGGEYRGELVDGPYLGLGDKAIQLQASEIAGGATNAYEIAMRIEDWLHRNMTATPTVGLPRSASEILHDRQGVCRDYALLFTALARTAEVPTRICGGLVGYEGRFYYHAWAECYVGGVTGWLPFDPTLYESPVDASHIPLVRGNPTALYGLEVNIGSVKVRLF